MREEILSLLNSLNEELEGNLIPTSIENYVDKIIENATIVTIYKNNELEAFIAFYDNDVKKENAYLTMIAVKQEKRNMNYAKMLLDLSIRELTKMGFRKYGLEVYHKNHRAMELYKKYGFEEVKQKGVNIFMQKHLKEC